MYVEMVVRYFTIPFIIFVFLVYFGSICTDNGTEKWENLFQKSELIIKGVNFLENMPTNKFNELSDKKKLKIIEARLYDVYENRESE